MQTRVLIPKLMSRHELARMFLDLASEMVKEDNMIEVLSGQTRISTSMGSVQLQLETGLIAPTTWNVHDVIGLMNDDAGLMGDDVPDGFFSLEDAEAAIETVSDRLEEAAVQSGNQVLERLSDFNLNVEALMVTYGITGYEALTAQHGEGFRAFVCSFENSAAFLAHVSGRTT